MGTNYYHERDTIPTCARCGGECGSCAETIRVHIGKSSAGWTFGFHATDEIRSYAEWLAALEAGGRIVDEYGREHSLADFKALVEAKRSASHNHAAIYRPPHHDTFLDADGHSFHGGEFS